MSTMVAVSPTLRGDIDALHGLFNRLRESGFQPWAVPTSAGAQQRVDASGLPNVSIGANPGFGAAVTYGLTHVGAWDWALIINDDIELDAGALSSVTSSLPRGDDEVMIYLDPVAPKSVPGLASTLGQVSLLSAVAQRLPAGAGSAARRGQFRPFSIVLISRGLWERLGGLDESLPYTFEDADFARRAGAVSADVRYPTLTGVRHPASATSRRHVDTVLPVAAWSAMSYLAKWHLPRPIARGACVLALVARLPITLVAPLDRRSHVRGVLSAVKALATDTAPALPLYDSL